MSPSPDAAPDPAPAPGPRPIPASDAASLPDPTTYVSRGALKLHAAIAAFGIDPAGRVCADLGCSTGGFTDCWLRHGAARVYAVDTAYGQLAWKLRQDPRVVVMERSNALHTPPPPEAAGATDFISIDLSWTPQRLALPAALAWLSPGPHARIVTLVKPHYEIDKHDLPPGGVLDPDTADAVARRTLATVLPPLGLRLEGLIRSPVLGGAVSGKKKRKGSGNTEHLALLAR